MRRAPGTFIWLAILLVTTILLRTLPASTSEHLLGERSTNLYQLSEDPARVLFQSAFWLDTGGYTFYLIIYVFYLLMFLAIHAPVERWLGTTRWLVILVVAHVGATYISQGVLYWAIDHGIADESKAYSLDYGVSYALMGVAGVLFYRLATPWRYYYLGLMLTIVGLPLILELSFTAVGHFSALLIGLACYPLVRWPTDKRDGGWNPATAWRARHQPQGAS